MDVVAHYSPPKLGVSHVHASACAAEHSGRRQKKQDGRGANSAEQLRRHSLPATSTDAPPADASNVSREWEAGDRSQSTHVRASKTFNRSVQIALMEPVGSMSLSPANRDVVLAARKGLFIIDLENPYDQPRFLPHLTTWVPADVQWNPHPARANWVASTSNNKLLVWNLDRPAAPQIEPVLSGSSISIGGTSPMSAGPGTHGAGGLLTPSTYSGTLPHPHHPSSFAAGAELSTSRLSSISHTLHAHTRAITDINWSPFHPEILASCGIDTWTWAWDLRDPSRPKQGYSAWNAAMTQVKWNRATPHRLATSCDNKVLIWDDRKGALPLATIEAHENKIYGVDWSRDTSLGLSRLVTCSLDGSVKWWDLDSPAAQQAIGQRQLVTEPETTIETKTPIWRARHLPFGHGVMTLPQRGDTSLSMWNKDVVSEPVHRFEGHTDTVKEYLIRTRGGSDRSHDDRQFQLITWSKDQTLRLWPISREIAKAAGHRPEAPIRVLQTRINAPDVSYRAPPALESHAEQNTATATQHLSPSSANATPTSSSSFAVPSGAALSLLSGNARTSASKDANLRVKSPSASFGSSPTHIRSFQSGSFSRQSAKKPTSQRGATSNRDGTAPMMSISQVALHDGQHRRRVIAGAAPSLSHSRHSGVSTTGATRGSDGQKDRKEKRRLDMPSTASRLMTKGAASENFMTRGTVGQAGQGRLGAAQKGNASRVDAVGWIAGVRMGGEAPSQAAPTAASNSTSEAQPHQIAGAGDNAALGQARKSVRSEETSEAVHEEAEEHKETAQIISEEIMTVSKRITNADFEKIDVSARTCTVTCYGPWAGRNVPCFVRLSLNFPSSYPVRAPRFELEHNASVPLKTRAFLLRNVSATLAEHARRRPPAPSMEAVVSFLLGDTLPKDRGGDGDPAVLPHWLTGEDVEESDDESDLPLPGLKLLPARCGASFSANGTLVVFRPTTKVSLASSHSARPSSTNGNSDAHRAGVSAGGARFLQSYTALAGAMSSLARLSKDGVSVQDLDVVQLMGDQDFFAKRLHNERRAGSSKPGSAMPRQAAHIRDGKSTASPHPSDLRFPAHAALQSRLRLTPSSSRPSSRARPAGRARSASPMSTHDSTRRFGNVLTGFASVLPHAGSRSHITTEARSDVVVYDISRLVRPMFAPPMLRKRSNSTPLSPASLTPRAELNKRLGMPLALPYSLQRELGAQEPQGISASRLVNYARQNDTQDHAGGSASASGRLPDMPPGVRIAEIDAAEAANYIPHMVAGGGGGGGDSEDDYGSDSGDSDSQDEPDELNAEQLLRETTRDALHPAAERFLDTLIWAIPFGFLYLMMDIMIQQQYASHPTFWSEIQRMAQALPMLTAFIYYTAVKPASSSSLQGSGGAGLGRHLALQLLLLVIGTSCGCGFLYVYTRSSADVVMRRTAPLGTLWMYSVVRLDLSLLVVSLAVVYGFVSFHELPLFQ